MATRRVDDSCMVLPVLDVTVLGPGGHVIRHADGRLGDAFSRGRPPGPVPVEAPRPAPRRATPQPVDDAWALPIAAKMLSVLKWTAIIALGCVGLVGVLIARDFLAAAGLTDD